MTALRRAVSPPNAEPPMRKRFSPYASRAANFEDRVETMARSKKLFERIRLSELRTLQGLGSEEPALRAKPTVRSNVQKQAARPKRSIRSEGEDHPVGLWIDRDMFRKHQNGTPRIVIHDPLASINNRYLMLADLALKSNKAKS